MVADSEWKWHADRAVQDIRRLVNLEEQTIKKEHSLREDILDSIHHIMI